MGRNPRASVGESAHGGREQKAVRVRLRGSAGFLQSRSSPELVSAHIRLSIVLCNLASQLVRLLQYILSFEAILDDVLNVPTVRACLLRGLAEFPAGIALSAPARRDRWLRGVVAEYHWNRLRSLHQVPGGDE